MIKKTYQEFLEKLNVGKLVNLNVIYKLPLEKRKDLKKYLESIVDEDGDTTKEDEVDLNESYIGDLKFKISEWINKRVFAWLISQSEKEILEIVDHLTVLDPTDFSNLKKKPETIYLGGGIDKTPDNYKITNNVEEILTKIKEEIPKKYKDFHDATNVVEVERRTDMSFLGDLEKYLQPIGGGGSWRWDVENFFEEENVVQGENMEELSKTGKLNKSKFKKPIIVNPLRNESNKRMAPKWVDVYRKWKEDELTNEEDMAFFKREIMTGIVTPDLKMVNACDTNFVRLDGTQGAGTLGEAEMSRFRKQNIFVWITDGYDVSDLSPWLIPSITKLVRTEDEVELLFGTLKNMYK